MLLTRLPLSYTQRYTTARLACLSHAASVHSEPGSNSPYINLTYRADSFSSLSLRSHSVPSESVFYYLKVYFIRFPEHLHKVFLKELYTTKLFPTTFVKYLFEIFSKKFTFSLNSLYPT